MNSGLKWKLIAGFLLVFIAGGAAGFFIATALGHHFLLDQHPPSVVAQTMKNRLRWQLRLTDEQMTKISPIIDKTASQLAEIRGDTGKRVRDVIVESHKEIEQYLTPPQQQRLRQMEERRRQWMQQHHPGWRRNGPGGPATSAMPETTPEASPQ
jgi:gas vesicle protein